MDKPVVRISVRNLVEFILRSGDLDNRGGSSEGYTADNRLNTLQPILRKLLRNVPIT